MSKYIRQIVVLLSNKYDFCYDESLNYGESQITFFHATLTLLFYSSTAN